MPHTTDETRWPPPATLAENEARLLRETERAIADFERELGRTSMEMVRRAHAGELDESEQVAEWLITLETLGRLGRER